MHLILPFPSTNELEAACQTLEDYGPPMSYLLSDYLNLAPEAKADAVGVSTMWMDLFIELSSEESIYSREQVEEVKQALDYFAHYCKQNYSGLDLIPPEYFADLAESIEYADMLNNESIVVTLYKEEIEVILPHLGMSVSL